MCGGKYNLIPSHPHRPRVMSPNLTTVGLNYSETKFQILARITFCFVDWDYILKRLYGYFAGSQGQGANFCGSNQIWHIRWNIVIFDMKNVIFSENWWFRQAENTSSEIISFRLIPPFGREICHFSSHLVATSLRQEARYQVISVTIFQRFRK